MRVLTAREIVDAALELSSAERADYMAQACGGDQQLLANAQAILIARVGGLGVTETQIAPVEEVAARDFIGPYRILRKLGEGGMGIVYHAQQQHPIRRDVALKIIKPGMDSKQVIARFESERQAVAMMDHPNIARVYDAGTTEKGLPYFAMELVDGVPITSYCDSKRLTIGERIELFIPVCQAIQHAHQKGIIHRDIKPSNVLVRRLEGKAIPKVIDFGLAKAIGNQLSGATMMTNLGVVAGTLQYMSPEQAEMGRQDVDTRSDVYSLGALFYELLTGAPPLDPERMAKATYVEILQRIREEEPKLPSRRVRESTELNDLAALRQSDQGRLPKLLHHELDWITMKAVERDRTRRYETVNALVRDLQRFLGGEPVEAAPPSSAYRMRKFVSKHRLWLSTAAALTLVLVAAVTVSTWMAVRAGRAEEEARAVNDFLQNDVLAQASASNQARPDTKPDPNLSLRTALDRAAARIEGKFSAQPLVEASIRQTIGSTYIDLGVYPEAQRQIDRALHLRRSVLGEGNSDTLNSLNSLATVIERQGKYAQAESLYFQVLDLRSRVMGKEDPNTLKTMYSLATTYAGQGKYSSAESLLTRLVGVQRRILGDGHRDTLASLGNLAAVYHLQRKYAQSESLNSQVLESRRHVLGKEHPLTLTIMTNLAEVHADLGKYAQAELLYSEVLEIQRRVLGENHRSTIYTLKSLAGLYGSQRQFAQAERSYTQALEAARPALGPEHPLTLACMSGLADTYTGQGKYSHAEPLYSQVLESRRRVLGPEHPDTIKTLAAIGELRLHQREYAKAETALRDALDLYVRVKNDGWERFKCQSLLGLSLSAQKKYAEAEPLAVSGYEGMIERQLTIPAGDKPALQEAGARVVRLYNDGGKPEKAVEWDLKIRSAIRTGSPKNP